MGDGLGSSWLRGHQDQADQERGCYSSRSSRELPLLLLPMVDPR